MTKYDLTLQKVRTAYDWCMEQFNELLEDGCCLSLESHKMDTYDALMTASICLIKHIPVNVERRENRRIYCPVCHKQQPNKIANADLYCERCGQRLTAKESNNVTKN